MLETGFQEDSTPYAVGKMAMERLAKAIAALSSTKFIGFRVGHILPGENIPDLKMHYSHYPKAAEDASTEEHADTTKDPKAINEWNRSKWLSNEDFLKLFELAGIKDLGQHEALVFNCTSENSGSPIKWDMSRAKDILGFENSCDYYDYQRLFLPDKVLN